MERSIRVMTKIVMNEPEFLMSELESQYKMID